MNNGDKSVTHAYPTGELVPLAPNSVVTPEDYKTNLQRIQQVKAALAFYEQQNNNGLQRFYEERQALEAAVEQGRLAAQRLAQLDGQLAAAALPTPQASVAGPPSVSQASFLPQFQTGGTVYDAVEMPTSARIVELPSPHVDRPATAGSSSARAGYAHDTQRLQSSSQQPSLAHPQFPGNNMGGTANHMNGPTWSPFPNAPAVGTHIQPYQTGQWARNHPVDAHAGVPQTSQHSLPQSAQPSFTARIGKSTTQNPPPPPPTRQPPSSRSSGVQPIQPTASNTSHQPRYGTSTVSSLEGALGATSNANLESVPHAKITYSSRGSDKSSQAAASTLQRPQVLSHPTIDPKEEQQLFEFFKRLRPSTVKLLMVQVLTSIERKQNGQAKSAAEEQAGKALNQNMLNACEVISERLKNQPIGELNQLFMKFFTTLKLGRELAEQYASETRKATWAQHPVSTNATPNATIHPTTTVLPQTASIVQPPQQPPSAASSQHTSQSFVQHIPPLPTQSVSSMSAKTAPRMVPASQVLQPTWVMPQDPKAPMAYRDKDGRIRYVYPPAPLAKSDGVPGPNYSSTPSSGEASTETQGLRAQSTAELEPPGTPEVVEVQSESAWSPEKADRKRLAQDIMRSLGRPSGSFSESLAPALATPSKTKDAQTLQNGKRRPSESPGMTTPSKKPRTVEQETPITVPASTPASTSVIDLTSSTSEDTVDEPMRVSPNLDSEPAVPVSQPPRQEPEESDASTRIIPTVEHQQSAGSSEVADTEGVQTTPPDVPPPESVASGPPSSAKSASPPRDVPDVIDPPSVDEPLLAMDVSETLDVPSITSLAPEPKPDSNETASSSQARERVPLFLPSPSSSPGASGSAHGVSPVASQAEDVLSDGELAPRAIYGSKGKGRALQFEPDIDLTTPPRSPPRSPARRSKSVVFVDVPPLPQYARNLREARSRDTGASSSTGEASDANASDSGESMDELAEWHEGEDRRTQEEEIQEAVQMSYERMRESLCQWVGCGAVLNSGAALQDHAALHASDNEEWGTYACRWQNCSHRFSDETKLAQHVRKHVLLPFHCAYEGCEKTFNTTEALLAHHRWSKHQGVTLRRTPAPFTSAGHSRALPPLPDVLPAYLSVPRRVSRHPISKERHQWLGPKVLENITAFKYSGGRSHAGVPSRGSRRLAEKVVAAELAGITPEAALEQIKRWIDDEYLAFADGYDAARRPGLRCADIPSQEVTQLVDGGLVLWPGEDDQKQASASAPASARGGPEEREGRDADERRGEDADNDAGPGSGGEPSERATAPAPEDQPADPGVVGGGAPDVDQLMDDVGDGGDIAMGAEDVPAGMASDAEGDAGGRDRLELPRRSHVSVDAHESAPVPGQGDPQGGGASVDVDAPPPDLGGSEDGAGEFVTWPVWPPEPPRADSEAVESLL